ncbi:MAG: carboxypeptidase-like regulatory domain-containing protein [Pyrinomonadaceae bacterium]
MKLKLQFIAAIFIALVINIPAVQAQASLTFSGGNGTPLSITLLRPVTYEISNGSCLTTFGNSNSGPLFLFDEAGNPFGGTLTNFTGSITYSVNGGTAQSITRGNSGTTSGDRTPNDIFVTGATLQQLNVASRIVLSAGTITTTGNVAAAPPANGNFTTFITNNVSTRCSTNGVSALPPTAASVSVGGRVMTASGRGIVNVSLILTDSNGQIRTARTSAFGYYHFDAVQAGETYILSAVGKRFTFSQPVQVLNVNEAIDAVNFIADSDSKKSLRD